MAIKPTIRDAPRRIVLADETYDSVRAMILEHEISPGQHVSIDELARGLSVSQTPVREALARLEADGLVSKIPLRGYEATPLLSVHQFDELFHFRGVIEPWAAAEAARRNSSDDIDALQAELVAGEGISRGGDDSTYREFIEHDTRFHTLVARASRNSFVEDAFVRTHCHMHLFRVYKATLGAEEDAANPGEFVKGMFAEYYERGRRPLALSEHVEIVGAIAEADSRKARALMLRHIDSSRQRFIAAVEALNATA